MPTTLSPTAMVHRYEQQVATHPTIGPLTRRQQTETRNLQHWRAELTSTRTTARKAAQR